MLFSELYGSALDNELGTDSTVLFTTVRRKAAINEAAHAFARDTGILKRYGTIPIVSGTATYSTDDLSGYERMAGAPSIRIVEGSNTRYIQGPTALQRYEPEQLDIESPGWAAAPAGTPAAWYMKRSGGYLYIGLTPAPSFSSGTWTLMVPYISQPPNPMVGDSDVPYEFTDVEPTGYPLFEFYPFHQALVHYAASRLERLRKNYDVSKMQMADYLNFVNKWFAQKNQDSSPYVQFSRNYYQERPARLDDYRT